MPATIFMVSEVIWEIIMFLIANIEAITRLHNKTNVQLWYQKFTQSSQCQYGGDIVEKRFCLVEVTTL